MQVQGLCTKEGSSNPFRHIQSDVKSAFEKCWLHTNFWHSILVICILRLEELELELELESARKIIDILQKELDTNVPSKSECESSCVSRQETLKQANSTEWSIVPAKYTKYTL